jgi:hypothetical protein
MSLTLTILGCGSSGGVPRIGNNWGQCDPNELKNRRRRCSVLLEKREGDALTRVLVDTTPDLVSQLNPSMPALWMVSGTPMNMPITRTALTICARWRSTCVSASMCGPTTQPLKCC